MINKCSFPGRSGQTISIPVDESNLYVTVRPEIERLAPYTPGESLQEFSQRTGFPQAALCKLNCNESPYGPVEAVQQIFQNVVHYNQYPDTQSRQLKTAL